MHSLRLFLRRYWEVFLVAGLFLGFIVLTVPGIAWGTPGFWHADELVKMADRALRSLTVFDTRNFDYPSLPKYVQYWLGRTIYSLGYSRSVFIKSARFVSVLLGGMVVVCAYLLTRLAGGGAGAGLLAALLLISSSEMALNARFAHNDLYLTFFTSLSALALLLYQRSLRQERLRAARWWLYTAFLAVGLAASSKYNGISLALAVLAVGLAGELPRLRKAPLRPALDLSIGLALTGLGFLVGTPRALLALRFYAPRALEALQHHAVYGMADTPIGLLGQWPVLVTEMGLPAFGLAAAGLLWALARVWSLRTERAPDRRASAWSSLILLTCLLALDLPIQLSYNYQPRFFLPMLALLAVLSALGVQDWLALAESGGRRWLRAGILAACVVVIAFNASRTLRVGLLFLNDSRIAAGSYLAGLPQGSQIEYTLYPPNLPEGRFKTFNYPIFFQKVEGVGAPDKPYRFNQGEKGIEKRRPDYLVVDSFTANRFSKPQICQDNPLECDFFLRLRAGQTNYRLVQTFAYSPPAWLPDAPSSFLNPTIQVYERVQP